MQRPESRACRMFLKTCLIGEAEVMSDVSLHVLNTGAPVYHDSPGLFYRLVREFLDKIC